MAYLPVLTYHRLLAQDPTVRADPQRISVSQKQFRGHLRWLRRLGYQTIGLDDYVKKLRSGLTTGGRTFAITFDDGYEEVLTLGLPILREFGYMATVFAVSGEDHNRWDDGRARLMSDEDLRAWRQAGMEVGAHSGHHDHLPQVPLEAARKDLKDCKARLESVLGNPILTLAYPYGESTPAVEAAVRDAGFNAAFATDRAPADHAQNHYRLRRVVVFPRNTPWEILMKVQRWYPTYQDWKR